jgi:hypothetical protein
MSTSAFAGGSRNGRDGLLPEDANPMLSVDLGSTKQAPSLTGGGVPLPPAAVGC